MCKGISNVCWALLWLTSSALSADQQPAPTEPWLAELNRSPARGKPAAPAKGDDVYKNAQVGAQLAGYLDHDAVLLDSPEINAYLQAVAEKLLGQWKGYAPEMRFILRSTAEPCAYSDVEHNIVVCTGFLQALENEDQLAALLGHELSHVLLGHTQDASTRRVIPVGMEVVGTLTAVVKQREAGSAETRLSPQAAKALSTTQIATTLWSDMLAPSWNRDQERDADRLGLDLMRAAGYNEGAFAAVLLQLDNVRQGRSERMEALRQSLVGKATPKKSANQSSLEELGQQLEQQATEAFANNLFEGLNNYSQNYDAPDERLRLLQEYSAAVYAKSRRDKKAQADRFSATLRNGKGAQMLAADRRALKIREALDGNDLRSALAAAEPTGDHSGALSLALARSDAFVKARRYDQALPLLESAARSNYAPGVAYRDLANAHRTQRKWTESLTALQLGGQRLGRETNFLPDLVETSRLANNLDAAENYTMRCKAEQTAETLKNPLSLLKNTLNKQQSQQPAAGLYGECIRRLGYDPAKKNQAEQKNAPDVGKALKGLFGK